ncbi:MAG: hypothetical protein Q8P79_00925 [Nanoarchaeota archaeon]|nr:hypothetical protein [Nanoarchaeota archaeon]
MKLENKHGELTTTQLVTIIILIVSFVIILFLLFRLDLGGTTNQEICRNSVVLKGQSQLTSGPLDCKINYLCISGGSDCEATTEEAKVNSGNKTEIMNAIASEMLDCWWQFGEGKVNYGGGVTSTSVHYAICSIISFDEKVREKVPEISYSEFYNFLSTEKKGGSGTETYLQYLYEINNINSFVPQKQVKVIISQDKILTNEKYSIITGIDNNLGDDEILMVYIIPTAETSSRLETDREFVTKA